MNLESNIRTKIEQFLVTSKDFFSQREEEFLNSLVRQLSKKSSLTPGQQNWLNTIMDKYNPEFIELERLWKNSFSDVHRSQALKVAAYYRSNPPYYSNYIHRIDVDPVGFVLTRREWDKFCGNKYAKKVLETYDLSPKFSKNDCVQVRANNRLDLANVENRSIRRNDLKDRVGFILELDAKPVTRAAKGSRIYRVLLSGTTSPIYAHESDLKKKKT